MNPTLNTSGKSIKAKTTVAPNTDLVFVTGWFDQSRNLSQPTGPNTANGTINEVYANIIASPGGEGVDRHPNYISITNVDNIDHTVTFSFYNAGDNQIFDCFLRPSWKVIWLPETGWQIYDEEGLIQSKKKYSSIIEEIQVTGTYKGKQAYVYSISGRRQGFNDTATPHDLKEFDAANNFFTQLTGLEALEIVSSSLNDTNTAGTGIRTVIVTYLDTNNNIVQSAPIALNGVTPVAVGFTANEILWMESASAGSARIAQGNIVLRIVAGPVEIEQITQNSSKSKTGKFMIPDGYSGYLYKWSGQAVNNDQDVFILAQCDTLTRALTIPYHYQDNIYIPDNNPSPEEDLGMLKIPALSRVKVSTISAGTGISVRSSASFIIIIVKN